MNIIIVMLLQLQGDFLVSNQEKCFMCCSKPFFNIFFYFANGKKKKCWPKNDDGEDLDFGWML